jgi:hypothetical protein
MVVFPRSNMNAKTKPWRFPSMLEEIRSAWSETNEFPPFDAQSHEKHGHKETFPLASGNLTRKKVSVVSYSEQWAWLVKLN